MEMDERKIKILQAIVDDYINTGEPVGSRTIAKKYNLGVSPATIRNEMSDLEEMGYLVQLHTSSGRIPSDKGYRLYVDRLMIPSIITPQEKNLIHSVLNQKYYDLSKIIKSSTELLSHMTKLTCVVKTPSLSKSYLKSLQIVYVDKLKLLLVMVSDSGIIKNAMIRVDEEVDINAVNSINTLLNSFLQGVDLGSIDNQVIVELKSSFAGNEKIFDKLMNQIINEMKDDNESEIYVEGIQNLISMPEYKDINKVKNMFDLLEDTSNVNRLLKADSDFNIIIGEENKVIGAKECSLIKATYKLGDRPLGTIGLIGPTRIPYSRIVSILTSFVNELNRTITKRLGEE